MGKEKSDLIQRVLKAQPRLNPTKIARDGSILEWVNDYFVFLFPFLIFFTLMHEIPSELLIKILKWEQAQDFEDPEVHHRHVSHLYGLFPGHTITVEKTPDLCKAADYTLVKRGNFDFWKSNNVLFKVKI